MLEAEVISRADFYRETFEKNYSYFKVVGIGDDSRVYDGLNVTLGDSLLQEGEAYVWVGSEDADELQIGDMLTFNYTLQVFPQPLNMSLQLKVAGSVSLDETAAALVGS